MDISVPLPLENVLLKLLRLSGHFLGKLEGRKEACAMCVQVRRKRNEGRTLKHPTHVNSVVFPCVAKCVVKNHVLPSGIVEICSNQNVQVFCYSYFRTSCDHSICFSVKTTVALISRFASRLLGANENNNHDCYQLE